MRWPRGREGAHLRGGPGLRSGNRNSDDERGPRSAAARGGTPDKPFGYYDATVDGGWKVPGEPYTVAEGSEFKWWRSRMRGGMIAQQAFGSDFAGHGTALLQAGNAGHGWTERRRFQSTAVRTLVLLSLSLLWACHPASAAGTSWRAQWITHPDAAEHAGGVYHFRRVVSLTAPPPAMRVRVSADNRYRLFVNGVQVATGPARSDPMHWRFETVDIAPLLRPGKNVIGATVWDWGKLRPAAQMSLRTAFLLQAESAEHAALDSGTAWKVIRNDAHSFVPSDRKSAVTSPLRARKSTPTDIRGIGSKSGSKTEIGAALDRWASLLKGALRSGKRSRTGSSFHAPFRQWRKRRSASLRSGEQPGSMCPADSCSDKLHCVCPPTARFLYCSTRVS